MPAKPISVTFLHPDGSILGTKTLRPQNQNYRVLGARPRVSPFPRTWDVRHPARDCEPYEGGWAIRLLSGDPMPLKVKP